MPRTTVVHLLRHGEVQNPTGVLYGRAAGYGLSQRGHRMAQRVADSLVEHGNDIASVTASPLLRAQQTAAPIAAAYQLPILVDERVIEAANHFEGTKFGVGDSNPLLPKHWRYLWNPLRPSWGEPYTSQVARVLQAVAWAASQVPGREALIVAHQLPIWSARSALEGWPLAHDPRKRQCSLASLTSISITDGRISGVDYSEPAKDLVP